MSNRWLSNVAIFAVGAAIGSVVTWKFLKTKYERIAEEEIQSVKEAFFEKEEEEETQKESFKEYANIISSYVPNITATPVNTANPINKSAVPYVISPDQFGEGDYEAICLTYYADGVLADFNDDIIDNIVEVVGPHALDSFGEFQDDVIHVRDESQKIDYEIVQDPREYHKVVDKTPFVSEIE